MRLFKFSLHCNLNLQGLELLIFDPNNSDWLANFLREMAFQLSVIVAFIELSRDIVSLD